MEPVARRNSDTAATGKVRLFGVASTYVRRSAVESIGLNNGCLQIPVFATWTLVPDATRIVYVLLLPSLIQLNRFWLYGITTTLEKC